MNTDQMKSLCVYFDGERNLSFYQPLVRQLAKTQYDKY